MSDTWQVQLVFSDGRSNKFWRARVEGSSMHVNYGRVGADGQSQVKDFSSAAEAEAALEKQAAGKRKKGYTDDGAATSAAPAEVAAPTEPQAVELTLEQGGRKIALTLEYDGQTVRTTVAETYDADDAAAAAFVRIQQALLAEGYKRKP
jgi:predicted DNA-binding WGR domain protein